MEKHGKYSSTSIHRASEALGLCWVNCLISIIHIILKLIAELKVYQPSQRCKILFSKHLKNKSAEV